MNFSTLFNNNDVTKRASLLVKTLIYFKSPFESDAIACMFTFCHQYLFTEIKVDAPDFYKKYAIIATGALIYAIAYQQHICPTPHFTYPVSWQLLLKANYTQDIFFNFEKGNIHLSEFIKRLGEMVLMEKSLPFNLDWFDQFSNKEQFTKLNLKERIAAFHPVKEITEFTVPIPAYHQARSRRCTIV